MRDSSTTIATRTDNEAQERGGRQNQARRFWDGRRLGLGANSAGAPVGGDHIDVEDVDCPVAVYVAGWTTGAPVGGDAG